MFFYFKKDIRTEKRRNGSMMSGIPLGIITLLELLFSKAIRKIGYVFLFLKKI
jgi:hypothetical protein